jgi:Response regulator of the LytR/AlgR family
MAKGEAARRRSVFLVEDEAFVRDELKFILGKYDQLEVIGEADNSLDAICSLTALRPEIVFLDIKLGDVNGIALAKKVREILPEIKIVFVTAFDDYAVEGFALDAVDYVLKPFSEERLAQTVERLLRDGGTTVPAAAPGRNNDKIIMRKNHVWKLVDIRDICYFQSSDHVTFAATEADTYSLNYTLRELELQLPADKFLRTHKSFIVNLDYVHEIEPFFNYTYKIRLKKRDLVVPVSRSYMKKFKAALSLA